MKQYLVVQRHTIDDIPVFLTTDVARADDFAQGLEPDGPIVKDAQAVLVTDASTPVCSAVYVFDDAGRLVDAYTVRVYEDDKE